MNEQDLDKFVENQYNEWVFNNDISKVEDIDQKDLKEAIEKDLAFVSKMTVQEYTLYEKWVEVHEKYKTAETNSFFDDKPALVDPTQEAFIKSVKNNIWIPESPDDIEKLEPVLEFTDDTEYNFKGQAKRGDLSEKWNTLRTFLSTMKNNSNIGRQMFFIVKDNRSGKYLGVICISGDFMDLTPRDNYIGWDKEARLRNSNMVANNYRFCLTPDNGIKNVGTMALKLLRVEGGKRWKEKYGDDLVMLETFVQPLIDGSDNKRNGAVYLADNWSMVGKTKGTSIKKAPVLLWQKEDSKRGELARTNPKEAIKKFWLCLTSVKIFLL